MTIPRLTFAKLMPLLLVALCGPGEQARSADSDPCDGLPEDAAFVVARSPDAGDRVRPPFEVVGCSRTFESTIVWRLVRRDGGIAAEGHAMGGGVDGPGPFRFTVEPAAWEGGMHQLEVQEPDASGGEGFPPSETVLPLVLEEPDGR